ncbi:glutathione S-transferase [Marinobacter vulgaris]|uniref:Glutathione S-transferase n=1 Tax=Marinobacter vulgaris TaxID=1928331 RepID=A0A2V3ZUC5_9GAMM|nr:glutathione S-transferase [Marinobacter vulgaris]TSJ72154.1 glutathione S-transferase family protein [Marinobacter vulgaris]
MRALYPSEYIPLNQLIIGNKNYSSWSLRPWLLLRELDIPFSEVKIPLYAEGSKEELLQYSPSGKVPAFCHESVTVWDSLAICEFVVDLYPEKNCWPLQLKDKAYARSISNEMHSGFFAIRNSLPMNCRKKMVFKNISESLKSDIDRVCEIWRICREKHPESGPFLFGDFSIADAMYAPIVLRFNSYGIPVGDTENDYMNTILSLSSLKEWVAEGIAEKEFLADCELEA